MDDGIEKIFNHDISNIRSKIIDDAVKIELLISSALIRLFGLELNAISFGNTSSSLSFISKINLLLDLKIMEKEEKEKFKTFAEIRNQFAHNLVVMHVNDCPESILKSLRKFYRPKVDFKTISDFQILYDLLFTDIKSGIERLIDTLGEMAGKKGGELSTKNFNELLYQHVDTYCKQDEDFKSKFIDIVQSAMVTFEESAPLSDSFVNSLPLL